MVRVRLLVLVILAFFAWVIIALPGLGCTNGGSGVTGTTYVGDSCYYAGFSAEDIDDFYYAVEYDYYSGVSYNSENYGAEDGCDYYCPIYDDQCYYDCVNCVYAIIDDVYLYKSAPLPAQKLDQAEPPPSTLREKIKETKK